MATKKSKQQNKSTTKSLSMPVINPHAVGIDIGSRSHFVCVGQNNVREFDVFTSDLHEIVRHIQFHKGETVAMESTGFYWQSLFLLLQDYGFEVILVNARHLKNVKGKKTDVVDSKWIQMLHSIGLLSASFQLDNFTQELRSYTRHRRRLIEHASSYISKMNKTLVLMNIQVSTVLSDLTGKSGRRIIEAIIAGERDAKILASLTDVRVKASKNVIEKSLVGDWREEYLFELKQCYEIYNHYWEKIKECDEQIANILENHLSQQEAKNGKSRLSYKPEKSIQKQKNDPTFDLRTYAYQLTKGVDLSEIPGVGITTILTVLSEVGWDLSKFPTAKHFASWLGLTPNNKISGGKILNSHTEKKKNNVAQALRNAANTVRKSKEGYLAHFFRRILFKKGDAVAITATARKIAIIIYNMLTKNEQFSEIDMRLYSEKIKKQKIRNVQKLINNFGIEKAELNFVVA